MHPYYPPSVTRIVPKTTACDELMLIVTYSIMSTFEKKNKSTLNQGLFIHKFEGIEMALFYSMFDILSTTLPTYHSDSWRKLSNFF